jgi:hypothetical protein
MIITSAFFAAVPSIISAIEELFRQQIGMARQARIHAQVGTS